MEQKKEGALEVVAMMAAILGMLFLLIWYAASNKIVFYFTIPFVWVSKLWLVMPGGEATYLEILQTAVRFRADSGKVGLIDWMSFVARCLRPGVFIAAALLFVWVVSHLFRKRPQIQRNFSKRPEVFLESMSRVFTGIAPILHLRMDLVKNRDDRWRRQFWPEELLLKGRVNGKPLVVDGRVDRARAEAYFIGGPREKRSSRYAARGLSTTMLGNLAVDLVNDHGKQVVYPDRFSPVGKIMFGLLCAYAFGDKRDYEKARDQLNNSCRGAQSGMPNLEVASWIFEKYRKDPTAHKLFAIHHWEYTYLFALFIEAKRRGKITHPQFLWLKPTERILFYVLNTVGRKTPHLESAGAFCQYHFERECVKLGRMPIRKTSNGEIVPGHAMQAAVEALEHEWAHLSTSIDDDDDWWRDERLWRANDDGVAQLLRSTAMSSPVPEEIAETSFDKKMAAEQRAHDERQERSAQRFAQAQWDGVEI